MSDKEREVRPWDFFSPNTEYASKDIQSQRLEICNSCPEFIKLTSQCKKCGCVMKLKTKLALAACPIEKWGVVEKSTSESIEEDSSSRIFINIPCYKDPELWMTVDNFIRNAKYPERISFGITLQSMNIEKDTERVAVYSNVSVDIIEPGSLVGCQPARKNSHKFYKNEEYYLNMDSHMRSIKNWGLKKS